MRARNSARPGSRASVQRLKTVLIDVPAERVGTWPRRWRDAREVLRESLVNFFKGDSLTISASIAYHSLLSIFPLMLLILGLSLLVVRQYEFAGRLGPVLERYLPMKPDFILRNLTAISKDYGRVGFMSFLLLFWSASGVFLPIEKALNRAWEVEKGRSWWRCRLLALEMAFILGTLILISSGLVGLNVHIHHLLRAGWLRRASPLLDFTYHGLILLSTFGLTLTMFLILFVRLPNRKMRVRQVFPSALLTAIFWEGARSLFSLLLPIFNYKQVYGSIGVVVALMTWAYISSGVMLFGAEVSRVLYRELKATARLEGAPSASALPSPVDAVKL